MMARWARWLVAAPVLAVGCGSSSPTAPAPSPELPSTSLVTLLAGTWSGFVRVETCADSQFGSCDYLPTLNPFLFNFTKGDTWSGTVQLAEPSGATVTVQGVEEPGGRYVVFSGANADGPPTRSAATVSALRLRADVSTGLVGELAYSYRHAGPGARTVTMAGTIGSASRGGALAPAAAADLDGTWQVSAMLESCSTYRGEPCSGRLPDPQTFLLVIRDASGPAPRAMVQFPSNVVADLVGRREPDGAVRFTGAGESPWSSFFRVEVTDLVVRADVAAGLVGRFEYKRHHSPGRNHDGGVAINAGSIASASRQAFAFVPGVFQGSWRGDIVPAGCVAGDCTLAENDIVTIRLSLTQAGDAVAGSVDIKGGPIPISGTASGRRVAFDGEAALAACRELSLYRDVCGMRIRGADLTLDEFGRLSGDLEFTLDERRASYTVRVRLIAVIPDL